MKKLVSLLLTAGLSVSLLAGCGSQGSSNNDSANAEAGTETAGASVYRTLDEIKDSGKITIGVFSDKNPFGYVHILKTETIRDMMYILSLNTPMVILLWT